MNCDLWRSDGRIFAHWTCLYFSLCLWVVILCPAFVSENLNQKLKKLKPKKNFKTYFCLKKNFFQPLHCLRSSVTSQVGGRATEKQSL